MMNLFIAIEIVMVFILAFSMSAFVLPRISLVSFRKRLFDQVNSRKVHTAKIPRLGGIAFFPAILVSTSLVIVINNLFFKQNIIDMVLITRMLVLFSVMFMIYMMGIMDDLVGVRFRSKFIIQILCGILLVTSGLYFDSLYGLFGIYDIPQWIGAPLTVFIIVFILNAINLIDGIDGLASGLSIIAFVAFGIIFIRLGWWMYALLAFASLGVLLPFFYCNVFCSAQKRRKLFMGDTGSLTIAMMLAGMAIRLSISHPVKDVLLPGSIVIAFSFLLVPMLDVVRVVFRRLREKRNPFQPDRNHIHHKFMALGMSQRQAMISILSIATAFALFNIILVPIIPITAMLLMDVVVWTIMQVIITEMINKKKASVKEIKQLNQPMATPVKENR